MAVTAIPKTEIENHIHTIANTKRIRPSEFFLDYDRLRSGYVSETQFFRVLWENLGVKVNEEDAKLLKHKYDLKQNDRINYRLFCENIDQPFNPNDLSLDPAKQQVKTTELLGTHRSLRPLGRQEEEHIEQLLRRLAKFYQYRGINLRTCCEDFDRHHIGVIQESQFYRSFPRPPDVTEEDVDLLVKKYRDPERGMLNYLNLHHDLFAVTEMLKQEERPMLPPQTNTTDFLPKMSNVEDNLQMIFDRIRVAVFKNRVRTIEFFKDYDKLRSGFITENQFVCGLSLAIAKEAQLTRPEIQKIVEFYKGDDGRVQYKEFCDMMENAFNIPDLEKKPTLDVVRPPQGALGRNLPGLTEAEEARLNEVLFVLSRQVKERRLMMYQYFKDYDRVYSRGYSRVITPTQFGRMLHFLSLNVAPEDLKLLCRKFADPISGDINYPAFVQVVDEQFLNYTQDEPEKEKMRMSLPESQPYTPPPATSSVSFDDLMTLIRHYVLTRRQRVIEYFQDYDGLRSGSITKAQFRRGLSDLGLSAVGQHNLNDSQFQMLCDHYETPGMPDKVQWTKFMNDVESVFTQGELEKNPTHAVPPQEMFVAPKPGTMIWSYASDDHKDIVNQVMERLAQRAQQRRLLAKPTFQDFDRHNNGHVTKSQFRQALNMLEMPLTETEMQALEAKFCNDVGFNYLAFLSELQPQAPRELMYVKRLEEIRLANERPKLQSKLGMIATDLEGVLAKCKKKVYKERVRFLEWALDYDKLRHGRINVINFCRVLDMCRFELDESEVAILIDAYQSPGFEGHVEYRRFSDELESIFTKKNLEKMPLEEVEQYKPPEETEQNVLTDKMEQLVNISMSRIAEKVMKNRIELFPLFEDYDKVHNGTVSRSQFRRVLSELELANLVATENEWRCLFEKFDVKIGGKDDVNYIAFCHTIEKVIDDGKQLQR